MDLDDFLFIESIIVNFFLVIILIILIELTQTVINHQKIKYLIEKQHFIGESINHLETHLANLRDDASS